MLSRRRVLQGAALGAVAYALPHRKRKRPPSGPLVIRSSNVTVSDKTFVGTTGQGYAIQALGTQTGRIANLTIRRCTFSGFYITIWAAYVDHLVIEDCTIEDPSYAGIITISCVGGNVSRNTIRRVGMGMPPATNAYGIAFTDSGGPSTTDILCDGNVIEDVPTWIGINTHNGERLVWTNNTTRRVRRAFFLAPNTPRTVLDCVVSNNRAESPGSALDPTAFFTDHTTNCRVTDNWLSLDWPVQPDGGDWLDYVYDQLSSSTGLVRSGNVRG